MTDIVERLRTFLGNGIGEDAAKEIESLRQQLEELKVNHKAELVMRDQNSQMCLDNTRKLLAESQAKFVECQAREALLEAADYANTIDSPLSHASLCRMAVEMP